MPNYLRKWENRTILVRPTKWDGVDEIPPWDCLDITDAKEHYHLYLATRYNPSNVMEHPIGAEIRKNYGLYRSRPFCKTHADNPRMSNPFFGCCVVASEALFFLMPEDLYTSCYRAMDGDGIYHWWVACRAPHRWAMGTSSSKMHLMPFIWLNDYEIIQDGTAPQFDGLSFTPPYDNGKKTNLMGWKQSPSKRTLDLIERISPKSIRYKTYDGRHFMPRDDATGNIDLDGIINTFDD